MQGLCLATGLLYHEGLLGSSKLDDVRYELYEILLVQLQMLDEDAEVVKLPSLRVRQQQPARRIALPWNPRGLI